MMQYRAIGKQGIIVANLDEIAHGLVTVLRFSDKPEPLGVDLKNHNPEQAIYLVQAVIDHCTAASVVLAAVRIDPDLVTPDLKKLVFPRPNRDSGYQIEGISLTSDGRLRGRVEFHRERPTLKAQAGRTF